MDKQIKISVCKNCEKPVRVADKDYLDRNAEANAEFLGEVDEYDLKVETVPAANYTHQGLCECED